MYHIKGTIDVLLPRCKFCYVAEDSTPALDAKMCSIIASKPKPRLRMGCACSRWHTATAASSRLPPHTQLLRAVPRAVSLRQCDTHEQR